MPPSRLEAFKRRLALTAYFRQLFGLRDFLNPKSVRSFYMELSEGREGYDPEGRSYVYNFLKGRVRGVPEEDLLRYDENVKRHSELINERRQEKIALKYFQLLPALMTEFYLDRLSSSPEGFLADLNAFVNQVNSRMGSRTEFPHFRLGDLNKLAFWMATGSGKTLLMHINYYQYLHYFPGRADNIILVTPNAGLSLQHLGEMRKSDVPSYHFTAHGVELYWFDPDIVKVLEITKLVEEKTGKGERIEVSAFEGRNLVFVDEGHKGAGSEAQAWRRRRQALAQNGFTFEYSATFGQALATVTDVEIIDEYSRSIIFDYSYPRFYDDGYGKDYRILNLQEDFDEEVRDRYLLANVLSFYEQVRLYARGEDTFYGTYNVHPPLLVFIGHSVTAGKTKSQLTGDDRKSLSDVQEIVRFLRRVLENRDEWAPRAITRILNGEAGLWDRQGNDLFRGAFTALRRESLEGESIYDQMLSTIFHAPSPGGLHLVNLTSAKGEIGLRVGNSDEYFGVINIGDDANFLSLVEEELPGIRIDSDRFTKSLFRIIKGRNSPINILVGAKKFIDGWDSWRVSTMGLMNIGKGEGPQIIQLFGRGVRLLGKGRSLKRSEALDGEHPTELPPLETLNVFGIKSKYMAQFRDNLADEGIDTDQRETLVVPTQLNNDFKGKGLLVVRPTEAMSFEEEIKLRLVEDRTIRPTIRVAPRGEILVSEALKREIGESSRTKERGAISAPMVPLLDWSKIFRSLWRYSRARGYRNLVFDEGTLQQILLSDCYDIYGPQELLKVSSFRHLERIERIAEMVLSKYIDVYYRAQKKEFEKELLHYRFLDDELEEEGNGNVLRQYLAYVRLSDTDLLEDLRKKLEDPALYESDDGIPERVHFDRHLYFPLLVKDESANPSVKYFPQGINEGERRFVRDLRDYFKTEDGRKVLGEWEVFFLRNQARGRGVGFLAGEYHARYFPDFILWLKGSDTLHIAFIDSKGLAWAGNLAENPKVQFAREIKEYQELLNERAGVTNIILSSLIISVTPISTLRRQTGIWDRKDYHDLNIFFSDDEIGAVLNAITGA